MNAVRETAEQLEAALGEVTGTRTYRHNGATVDPPALVLGPPELTWDGYCDGPTSASFTVFAVVSFDERALERLWDLVPLVAEAADNVTDAVVTRATPGTFPVGNSTLPSYEIQIEVAL